MGTSKDGTPVKEIVAEWLRANRYDGLCNGGCNCGCGLDDLMPCGMYNEFDCVCAYETEDADGERIYCARNAAQNQPSDTLEQVAMDMFEWIDGITHHHWTFIPEMAEKFYERLEALGVAS